VTRKEKMRPQQQPFRRPSAAHHQSPSDSAFNGRGGAVYGSSPAGCSRNWLLLFVVLILVPGNILVLRTSTSVGLSNFYLMAKQEEPSAAENRVAVRHVYHRQPDEVWSVDAKERKIHRPHDDIHEKDPDAPDESPDVPEETDDQTEIERAAVSTDGEHYSQSDFNRPAKEAMEEDDDGQETDKDDSMESQVQVRDSPPPPEKPVLSRTYAIGDTMPVLPVQISGFRKSSKTFVYFRSKGCPHLCQRAKSVGWTPGVLDFTSKAFPDMLLIRWTVYSKYQHLTRTLINQVGTGASCIGGGKGIQLLCRQQLATRNGCEFSDLNIQPKQWNLQKLPQCEDFFLNAAQPENDDKIWIMKPGGSFHGRGITLHRGDDPELRATYGECKKKLPDGLIVQAYIMNPALMSGHKFDLRTYLLVASTKPFLVFYHDGFVRRSEKPFSISGSNLTDPLAHITNDARQSEENHFFGFHQLEKVLIDEHKFPKDYMAKVFRPRAMRVTNYLFHTAIDRTGHKIEQRNGRFQFFALDWMIDSSGESHLLEGNGDPSVKHYPGTDLTPVLWESMFDLVEAVTFTPEVLGSGVQVARQFKYKGWKLVYNELEAATDPYQPCKINQYAKEKHPLYSYEP